MIGAFVEFTLQGALALLLCGGVLRLARGRAAASLRQAAWAVTLAIALVLVPLALVAPVVHVPLPWPAVEVPSLRGAAPSASRATVPGRDADLADVAVDEASPAPARPLPAPPGRFAGPLVLAVWALGAAFLLGRTVRARCALGRLRRRARPFADPRGRALADAIRTRFGMCASVELLESDAVEVPVAFGTLRPAVILPAEAAGWSDERLRVVLAHELAHVRRRDAWTLLVAEAARALHWHDPLAWRAFDAWIVERERACDDEVVVLGTSPAEYARHLLALASVDRAPRAAAALALSEMAGLAGRVHALLAPSAARAPLGRGARAGLALAGLGLVLACTLVGGASPPAPRADAFPQASLPTTERLAPGRVDRRVSPSAETDAGPANGIVPAGPPATTAAAGTTVDPWADPRSERADVDDPRARWPSDEEVARAPERDRILVLRAGAEHVKQFEHDYVRERSEWALTRVREGRIAGPLVESLADPDPRLRAYAAWALAAIGARESGPAIRPLLDDAVWRVRAQAASALVALEGALPGERLDRLAADHAWQVRVEVVESLRRTGGADARARLERMRDDPHGGTRLAVADALAEVRGE